MLRPMAPCFAICFVPRFVIYFVICFAPRFVPWPHAHGLIFRHAATTPFITSGRIQAVPRGDSRPGSAERTVGPEAIGCPDPGNGARRRLVVRARSDDGFGTDSRSESERWVRRRFAILIRSSDRNLSKIRCLGGFRKPIPPSLPKYQRLGGIAPERPR